MYPTINALHPRNQRFVAPYRRHPYGLIDALEQPRLVPIAKALESGALQGSSQSVGASPLRRLAGQVGLLDAFGDAEPGAYRAGTGEPAFPDIGERVVDAFVQAGKDLWTGYLIGASGMYDTLGDGVGLMNRANDFMTDWTGYGHMSEGTIWKDAENWLHETAARVAPAEEDLPTTFLGKGYAAVGQAPAELAQYLTAARWLGPIAGLASLDAIRASENGLQAAAGAAAKAAILGGAAKALDPLSRIERSAGLGSIGAASTFGSSGDPRNAIENAVLYGLLGTAGVPRIPQKNLVPLQKAYDEFMDAASIADTRLAVIKALSQKRQQQLRVGINRDPGVRLQDVARRSDELRGYTTTRGKRYELPDDPRFLDSRVFDYGRYKWWWLKRAEDAEVKREHAKDPKPQREANKHLEENEGVVIARRRENEILRRSRIQLGKEGRFDIQARDLGRFLGRKSNK
jgi:hypothetical protein